MPLLPPVLVTALLGIDEPAPPTTAHEAAEAWFEAWWEYYAGLTQLNPATLTLAKDASRLAFVPIFEIGSVPSPAPLPFFTSLETAIRAVIAITGTPAFLLPAFASAIPSPIPLAPMLLSTVPLGLISPTKQPPRAALALLLDGWTRTNTVQPTGPSSPVPFA